jgi:hypothetical protein
LKGFDLNDDVCTLHPDQEQVNIIEEYEALQQRKVDLRKEIRTIDKQMKKQKTQFFLKLSLEHNGELKLDSGQ